MTTTNKAKTKSAVRSFTKKPQFRDNPLPVLYSTRVRLTDDERQKLKTAYLNATALEKPPVAPAIGGSSVQAVTNYGSAPYIDQELGMERMIVMDILNSRDSVSLPILLKIQHVLGVEVITAKKLQDAFEHYLQYVMTMYLEDQK